MDIRDRLSAAVIQHRALFLVLMTGLTVVFALGLPGLNIATIFSDLLPSDHEHVRVFRGHPNFGSPLSVSVMIKRRDADIYGPDTLAKVWRMTWEVDRIPGVDHDQVISIATEKARVAAATPFGVESRPLMGDDPPAADEIAKFRERVARAPGIVPFLVSPDHRATLIRAAFIEHALDYRAVFRHLRDLASRERDARHDVYVAGFPMLIGWVYFYEAEMLWLFAVTAGAMFLALLVYTRNLAGVVTPLVVSAVSALWGLGFVGWIGHNVEPLIMVVPLLLVARSFSHSVQVTERYYEILHRGKTKDQAAADALRALLGPGTLGIVTDAAALFLIGVAPFPMMQKFALFCGFWALTLFPANVLLSPVILSYLPAPANVGRIVSRAERSLLHAWIAALLSRIAPLCHGPGSWKTGAALVIAVAIGAVSVARLAVGNEQEGSSLLWPSSDYNRAARELNSHFPGMNTLEIIFEGSSASAMRRSEAVLAMRELQRRIESQPDPPPATLSFADYLPEINRLFNGGNPKWLPLDRDERKMQGVVNGLLFGSNTKNLSQVVDLELRNGTVTVWLKDLKADTIDRALAQARHAMAAIGENHRGFRIRLGSGVAALQKAVNERIATYEWTINLLALLVIFITCSLAYRSVIASLILLIPVGTANLLLATCMLALGISLDVNTLPVMAIGIGIGIDYGIYLLSRLREEARDEPDIGVVIQNSVTTTGKAVFFTATIVLIGLLPWYALSNLKFQADMGLLLAVVMIINMASALVVVPFLVSLTRRRFAFGNA